jgi:hypothetical protein
MRVRLRDAYPDAGQFYTDRYPDGYQHALWPDHIERVQASVDFALPHLSSAMVNSVADLSCGDAAIVEKILLSHGPNRIRRIVLGDLKLNTGIVTGGYDSPLYAIPSRVELFEGPAETALDAMDPVDLFVCSETVEHLDDPDTFLAAVHGKARHLLLTTPEAETDPATNPEHYWGWDSLAVSQMLFTAGWHVYDHTIFTPVSADTYRFQMWMAHA